MVRAPRARHPKLIDAPRRRGQGIWVICTQRFSRIVATAWLAAAFCLVANSQTTAPAVTASDPKATVRIWKHPVEWYPASVKRWFKDLPAQLQYSEMRFKTGDHPDWAQPAWDDADWETRGRLQLPAPAGIFWMRFRVRMGPNGQDPPPAGIMITSLVAYDVFWDAVLLGSSGEPAKSPKEEQVGRVDQWFSIPKALCGPGEHVVAIRASSFRTGFPTNTAGLRFLVDSPAVLQGKALREAFVPTLAAGALFMVGLASLIMWMVASRRATLLLLGGLCFAASTMQALQAVRWFFHYPADWHYPVYFAMTCLVVVQAMLTVSFETAHFSMPRGRWILVGLSLAFAAVFWLSPDRSVGVRLVATGMTAALAVGGWAAWRQRRGAWPVVIGLATSVVLQILDTEDFRANYFITFLPALLGLIVSLAMRLRDERREAHAAQLAAARLELELLKKNIQPHFLLNTLATIIETIEQEPRTAVTMVEALAEEFRILSRVAGERLISLGEELELCRAHLRVMSQRKGVRCELTVKEVNEQALVPPALFHTLVENGLTHLQPREGRIDFVLSEDGMSGATRYQLLSRGQRRAPASGKLRRVGTGLRYVEARLEESFPQRWSLRGEPVDEGWLTVIELSAAAHSIAAG